MLLCDLPCITCTDIVHLLISERRARTDDNNDDVKLSVVITKKGVHELLGEQMMSLSILITCDIFFDLLDRTCTCITEQTDGNMIIDINYT